MTRQLRRLNRQEIWAGSDVTLTMSIIDTSGDAVDLTGATVTWKMAKGYRRRRVQPYKGAPKLTKTATITDAATGAVSIAIADSDIDGMFGDHWQQVAVQDSSGNDSFVGGGEIFIVREMGT